METGSTARTDARAPSAPSQVVDFTNFGQWLIEQQAELVQEMVGQQERGQAMLVRELTRVWKPAEGALGAGPLGRSPWPLLTKLGESDNIEAYLEVFERTAEAARWPSDQWAIILGPHLLGDALLAVKAMEKVEAMNYEKVKRTILDRYEINPETYRQCLRVPGFPEGAHPRAIITRLKDAATCWLKPTSEDWRRMVELIVIDQLLIVIDQLSNKVLALEHHPQPVRKNQLLQFLGFVGYYSKFIPKFADKAGPLTDCLTKGEPDVVRWTPARVLAFETEA